MSRKAPTPISLFDCDKPKYDYPGIDDPIVRADLEQRTTRIRRRMQQVAESIMVIGQNLEEVRMRLQHGQYRDWLQAEFKMSEDTALNFRSAWKRFGSRNIKLGNLGCSVVYLLAAPSTPQAAVEEVLEKDRQGEQVTVAEAKNIIKNHQTPTCQADEPEQSETENFGFWLDSDLEQPEEASPPTEEEEARQREESEKRQEERERQRAQEYLQRWQEAVRDLDALLSRIDSLAGHLLDGVRLPAGAAAGRTAAVLAQLGQRCQRSAARIRQTLERPAQEDDQ